jgi:hypothetical protein
MPAPVPKTVKKRPQSVKFQGPPFDENSLKIAKVVFVTVIFLRNRTNIPTETTLMSTFEVKNVRKRSSASM